MKTVVFSMKTNVKLRKEKKEVLFMLKRYLKTKYLACT